jgi:hypothetical protein
MLRPRQTDIRQIRRQLVQEILHESWDNFRRTCVWFCTNKRVITVSASGSWLAHTHRIHNTFRSAWYICCPYVRRAPIQTTKEFQTAWIAPVFRSPTSTFPRSFGHEGNEMAHRSVTSEGANRRGTVVAVAVCRRSGGVQGVGVCFVCRPLSDNRPLVWKPRLELLYSEYDLKRDTTVRHDGFGLRWNARTFQRPWQR